MDAQKAKIALTFKRRTLWQSHLRAFKVQQQKEISLNFYASIIIRYIANLILYLILILLKDYLLKIYQ